MKYTIIGSALSGNKGAASMLEASIQTISKNDKDAEFILFSMYPEEDKRLNNYKNLTILPTKPLFLGPILNSLALFYKIIPPLRPLLRKQKHINAIYKSNVYLDQGGITFVDGREVFLLYNVASILPAIFMNKKIVKCSQAMGPFNNVINKACAKLILPKVTLICARGEKTKSHLDGLGLKNVELVADYAFLLDVTKKEKQKAQKIIKDILPSSNTKTVAVLPSEVVNKKSKKNNQNYVEYQISFIESLLKNGFKVVLLAQSARQNTNARHNNDLPLCREIADKINNKNFVFVDKELPAQQLRYIISSLDFVVTSRFHAMISALSTKIPGLIVGWSHKYQEVLDMFKLGDMAIESTNLNQKSLQTAFEKMVKNRNSIIGSISSNIDHVKSSANKQVDAITSSEKTD